MSKIPLHDAMNPLRQTAISLMEELIDRGFMKKLYGMFWYEVEDLITSQLDAMIGGMLKDE